MTEKRFEVLLGETSYQQGDFTKQFAVDVLKGLSADGEKSLPSKYFYDTRGSELFRQITDADEYYPTQCEAEILTNCVADLAETLGKGSNLVELGAGDGRKTAILLDHLAKRDFQTNYYPIDISESAVDELTSMVASRWPSLKVRGLVSEYANGIDWIHKNTDGSCLVMFLGSSIGNFNYEEAREFLFHIRSSLNPKDSILIGFDRKKDVRTLTMAYNDKEGITAAFNLNLLKRINTDLGANFKLENFQFLASYNPCCGAVESYLISNKKQNVYIESLDLSFEFQADEPIHTEWSYKYSESDIERLAKSSGFRRVASWKDKKEYFVDELWAVT